MNHPEGVPNIVTLKLWNTTFIKHKLFLYSFVHITPVLSPNLHLKYQKTRMFKEISETQTFSKANLSIHPKTYV